MSAESLSPECRGVAAGVVAAMRAAGEVSDEKSTAIAVLAARRACTGAREDLGAEPVSAAGEPTAEQSISVWDLLTSDQKSKPGDDRLRRFKQQ